MNGPKSLTAAHPRALRTIFVANISCSGPFINGNQVRGHAKHGLLTLSLALSHQGLAVASDDLHRPLIGSPKDLGRVAGQGR